MSIKNARRYLLKNIKIFGKLQNYNLYLLLTTIGLHLIWYITDHYLITRFQTYLSISFIKTLDKGFHLLSLVGIGLTILIFLLSYALNFLGAIGIEKKSIFDNHYMKSNFKLSKKQTIDVRKRFYEHDSSEFNQLIDTLLIDIRRESIYVQIDYPKTHALTSQLKEYLIDIRDYISYTNKDFSFSNFIIEKGHYSLIGTKK